MGFDSGGPNVGLFGGVFAQTGANGVLQDVIVLRQNALGCSHAMIEESVLPWNASGSVLGNEGFETADLVRHGDVCGEVKNSV